MDSRFLLRNETIRRVFTLEAYKNRGPRIFVVTDACPWGFGGWLSVDGVITEYLTDAIHVEDANILDIDLGESSAQQAAEPFAILVCLREWHHRWAHSRVVLEVKTDNIAALTLVASLRGRISALNRIGRELALDISEAHYAPTFVSHSPVVTNVIADALSRRFQPGKSFALPPALRDAAQL